VLVGLVVAVLVAGLPARADTPETGADPSVTLTVTPDDGVSDGTTVTVTGTGFPANASGMVRQCAGSVAAPECDTYVAANFIAGSNGAFAPILIQAQRTIHTFTVTHDCSAEACAMVAEAGGRSTRHHISILAPGMTVPPTTSPPITSAPTTIAESTTVAPTTTTATPPTSTAPPATGLPQAPAENVLCAILRAVGELLPGLLGGIVNGLLNLLGCAPLAPR
jgi:hypothetical protein